MTAVTVKEFVVPGWAFVRPPVAGDYYRTKTGGNWWDRRNHILDVPVIGHPADGQGQSGDLVGVSVVVFELPYLLDFEAG